MNNIGNWIEIRMMKALFNKTGNINYHNIINPIHGSTHFLLDLFLYMAFGLRNMYQFSWDDYKVRNITDG